MTVAAVSRMGSPAQVFQCAQLLTVDIAAAPAGIGSRRARTGIACRRASITTAPTYFSISGSSLNFSRAMSGWDVLRARRRVGLIVPYGYGRSAGVARGRAFHGRWVLGSGGG